MKKQQKGTCACGASAPYEASEEKSKSTESNVRREVRKTYGKRARKFAESANQDAYCGTNNVTEQREKHARALYSEDELKVLPESAKTAAAGCGNPTAFADLKQGETVLDLGSGGGIDALLAAEKVGPTGRVIGVDMTPEMIDVARENASNSEKENVEFRLGEIEHLPVADQSVDAIISNCVINLSPEKEQVFKEAYRVLKQGGRMLVSDMMTSGLPEEARKNITLWASCVGGAIELEEYLNNIRAAGFTEVEVINKEEYSNELIKDSLESMLTTTEDKEQEIVLKQLAKMFDEYKGKPSIQILHAEIRATKNNLERAK